MRFTVKDSLTAEETQFGLKAVTKDGIASQALVTLTSGVFLVAFALKLGASNAIIGLLASIPFLAQIIQIPSIFLVEKLRKRRAITVFASSLSRVFWPLIALIPILFSIGRGVILLIIGMVLSSSFSAVSVCSWNSWMRDLIPQDRLGSFFSRRMSLALMLSIPLGLAAGFFIDYWKKMFPDYEIYGYSILFSLGFIAGMIGVYFISTIPEPRMALEEKKVRFFNLILQPFKDSNFRSLIGFSASWSFAVNLAVPFFIVYMLKRLELDLSLVIVLTALSQIMNFTFLKIWGKFSDLFSNKSVLGVSGPLFMICVLAWTFTTLPEKHTLTVPLLIAIHIFMGISLAGVTLATGNIGLKLAPKGQATPYLAAKSLINSLSAGIAPIFGGLFADFFSLRELSMTLKWISPKRELAFQTLNLQQWDFFFLLAFLIGMYSIHRLTMVKEVGEVEEKIVFNELLSETRRMARNLSSIGGIHHLIQFPYAIIKTPFKENESINKSC